MIVAKGFMIFGIEATDFVLQRPTTSCCHNCPFEPKIFIKYDSNGNKWFINHHPGCEVCFIDE